MLYMIYMNANMSNFLSDPKTLYSDMKEKFRDQRAPHIICQKSWYGRGLWWTLQVHDIQGTINIYVADQITFLYIATGAKWLLWPPSCRCSNNFGAGDSMSSR